MEIEADKSTEQMAQTLRSILRELQILNAREERRQQAMEAAAEIARSRYRGL
jgi:hypothetical protein